VSDDVGRPITVAIVNDYEVIVRGLAGILAPFGDRVVVTELEAGGEPHWHADVALFDTFASRRNSITRAREMVQHGIVDHVVLYTWDASAEFLRAADLVGVSGVVLKSQTGDGLVEAIEAVAAGSKVGFGVSARGRSFVGRSALSDREQEVLALIAVGHTNKEIAHELFLSVDTVKTHVRRLFVKLQVRNRAQAALLAAQHQFPPPAMHHRRVESFA
jgi:DNA-binding NarL/FixJ family response regulator